MSYVPRAALPARVLYREDVQEALVRRDFGRVFALVRRWGGISFSAIAESCDVKPERVGKLARGEGEVTSFDKVLQISDGLRVPGHMLGLLPRPWESEEPAGSSDSPTFHGAGRPPATADHVESPAPHAWQSSLLDRALSLSFTPGGSRQPVDNASALWQTDVHRFTEVRESSVSADEITPEVLRWLVAPPAVRDLPASTAIAVAEDDIAAIRRACGLFEALDHEFGGGHARAAAVQYLHSEVAPLLYGSYTAPAQRDLFSATAHFSYKVGAMAYDAALHGLARRYFLQALNFAHIAADTALAGKALALMSHQANFLGDFRSAVDFARSAKAGTRTKVTPGVYAMYSAMEARGLASLGEERQCAAALREMEDSFSRRDDEEPAWLDYFDAAEVHDEFAHCYHDLGHAERAAQHARAAITATRREYRRSRTFAGLTLASSCLIGARGRDVEQACGLAEAALHEAGSLRSARVHAYVSRFDHGLRPYAETAAVQRFREQVLPELRLSAPMHDR
ncbi:hypothetical protein GCM10023224_16030 [Streptomonospora halophila]|uniref:HD-GYP domain-containing protein n=1 Tax=Streptomonospora halophila TaxID=427369 RepID=A0ABP9GHX9_9ACTN